MSKVTMTLYEALSKKKIYKDRVDSLSSYRMVTIVNKVTGKGAENGEEKEIIDSSIQSGYDHSIAILENYRTLSAAINDANAKIQVEINGQTYSIANAIARYRALDDEQRMYEAMLRNVNSCKARVESMNAKNLSSDAISKYVSTVLNDAKRDDEIVNRLKAEYIKDNEVVFYDPLDTEKIATERLADIEIFREQYHYILTQANCTNSIEVEWID